MSLKFGNRKRSIFDFSPADFFHRCGKSVTRSELIDRDKCHAASVTRFGVFIEPGPDPVKATDHGKPIETENASHLDHLRLFVKLGLHFYPISRHAYQKGQVSNVRRSSVMMMPTQHPNPTANPRANSLMPVPRSRSVPPSRRGLRVPCRGSRSTSGDTRDCSSAPSPAVL